MYKWLSLLIVLFTCSCSSTYWKDRGNDLADSAHIDTEFAAWGLQVNLGPVNLGYFNLDAPGDGGVKTEYSFTGKHTTNISGETVIIGTPFYEKEIRNRKSYGQLIPKVGEIGFDIGLFYGFGVKVDAYEITDFMLGFAGVDIMLDDCPCGGACPEETK